MSKVLVLLEGQEMDVDEDAVLDAVQVLDVVQVLVQVLVLEEQVSSEIFHLDAEQTVASGHDQALDYLLFECYQPYIIYTPKISLNLVNSEYSIIVEICSTVPTNVK